MLNKLRKSLKSKEGFTLIELITVIVVLAIILGIGIPRYAKIQAQSEWDADVSTLKNLEKAAELYYTRNSLSLSDSSGTVKIKIEDIVNAGQFDGGTQLKRKDNGGTPPKSVRNVKEGSTDPETLGTTHKSVEIEVVPETGKVDFKDSKGDIVGTNDNPDGVNDWMHDLIGYRPK